jgi:hypothetical protein
MNKLIFLLTVLIAIQSNSQTEEYDIVNLTMNNENPHFGLSFGQNGNVLFTSYLVTKKGKVKKNGLDPILSLYKGKIDSEGNVVNINPLLIDSKQDLSHISSATFSPDGNRLYLSTNYANIKSKPKGTYKQTNFFIMVGEYNEIVGWTNFKTLSFCKTKYSYAHPNISPDGKTLYFIANIRGGKNTTKGPSDIFKVSINEDGTYGEPENLGANVNSYSREMFPFMGKDNVLYFSSNQPNGVGRFDIYKSEINDDNTFSKAIMLPKPINSKESDISFVIDEKGNGYLASKRNGGKGDDDIYYFTQK